MRGPRYTNAEYLAAAHQMAQAARLFPTHDLALMALLLAYTEIAGQHPCCRSSCIANLQHTTALLQALETGAGRPSLH